MAGEIGVVKREIAFSGDVLNTAARIQGVCNTYGKELLISEDLNSLLTFTDEIQNKLVDEVSLKGKAKPLKIYSIRKT